MKMISKLIRKFVLIVLCILTVLIGQPILWENTRLLPPEKSEAATDPVVGFFSPPSVWTSAADANLNLPQPDPRDGDLMVAVIAIRPAASTVDTPSDWTLLDSRTGTDGGAEGADTGSVGLYTFYKVSDGTEGTANQTFTETGTTSVWMGQIMKVRSSTGTYDIAAGGYSLNGDVTNWGGTLDSDIGLRSGDFVLMAAAQNGDLAGSSAQNINATGVNVRSVGVEHGEFASTTGNDIEVDLATSQIFEGNNSATPTVTTTMSVAASGTVAAVRIRQGSGSNRTDTWVRSAGRQVAGTTSVAVNYPEHEIGDIAIYYVGSRGSTDPTFTTPTGWTSLGSYTGGAGAWGADSGNAVVGAFYREINARVTTGTVTVSITNGLVSVGQMIIINKDDVGSWSIDSDGGSDNSAGTGWSVTGSGIDLSSGNGGDILLALSSINTDGQTYTSHGMSASGMTFGEVTQTGFFVSATSNDMALEAATGRVTAGSDSTVAPTFTSTAGGSTANSPAGSSLFVKIKGNDQTLATSHVGFFSPEATWTTSTTTTLSLRQSDPRDGDLQIAVLAIRPSSATIDTPSGWTLLDSRTGTDGGAEGADTGSVGLYWFYKVSDGSEGVANQAFTATGTPSIWIGSVMKARSATGTYSLAAGGYSINADATNWNGTLDTDIGLTQGDLILTAGAQNGNLSNTSAWDLTAIGVSQRSTTNEHGEFTTTAGNQVEIGLAETQIFEGTSTAEPDITLTHSAAVSGAVTAVRIRQGAGTNRTDTWVRSGGPQLPGTTSISLPYPSHEVGDMFVMLVGNRDSTDPTPVTPDGWTSLGSYIGGAGTFGADAGNARITAFYREATSRRFGTQIVTVSASSVTVAQMITIHRDSVTSWLIDSDGGSDNSAGTAWSVTGSGIDLSYNLEGDLVIVGSAMNTDARLYSGHAISASGITFGDVTQTSEYRTTTGNDMTLEVVTGRVSGGSATGVVPTFTSTANGSAANNPAGASLMIKIKGIIPIISIRISSDGVVDYGIRSTTTSVDTTSGGLNDTQIVENDGTLTADLNIQGQDSANWILSGSAGSNAYVHEFSTNSGGAWTPLTTSYQELVSDLDPEDTQSFDLRITTPTTTSFFTQQSVDITIQAVEP